MTCMIQLSRHPLLVYKGAKPKTESKRSRLDLILARAQVSRRVIYLVIR